MITPHAHVASGFRQKTTAGRHRGGQTKIGHAGGAFLGAKFAESRRKPPSQAGSGEWLRCGTSVAVAQEESPVGLVVFLSVKKSKNDTAVGHGTVAVLSKTKFGSSDRKVTKTPQKRRRMEFGMIASQQIEL
jgi:hypothetical protein